MTEKWFFSHDGDTVLLQRTASGDDVVGDARATIRPGESVHNLSYEDLRKAADGGTILIDGDRARISTVPENPSAGDDEDIAEVSDLGEYDDLGEADEDGDDQED